MGCRWRRDVYSTNDRVSDPKPAPKRQMRRLLKKEVSLDTYTWQKKYAHLTSNLVIPAVDERFKRRFSVSASMEEISKIPQNKEPQVCFNKCFSNGW